MCTLFSRMRVSFHFRFNIVQATNSLGLSFSRRTAGTTSGSKNKIKKTNKKKRISIYSFYSCYPVIAYIFSELLDNKFITKTIALDISKAFDKMWGIRGCYKSSPAMKSLQESFN